MKKLNLDHTHGKERNKERENSNFTYKCIQRMTTTFIGVYKFNLLALISKIFLYIYNK